MHAKRTYKGATHSHKQRRRDTLAANVTDDQSDVVIIDAEEVVEVTADILCRLHRGIDIQLVTDIREGRENTRQDKLLNLVGCRQVFLQSLQLPMFLLRLMYEFYLLDGFLDGAVQIIHIDRLRGEVEGTVVHGQSDILHVTVGTHHDNAQGRVLHFIDLGQHGQAVHHRHVDVTENNFDVRMIMQHSKTLRTVMSKEELIFATANLPSEILLHQEFDLFLIINT